jgi:hypothetical protein
VDAWWEERQETEAAGDLARGFMDDLGASLQDLQLVYESTVQKRDAALMAREFVRSSDPVVARDSINILLTTAGGIAVLSPVMRSYDQLVATGLLRRLTPPVRKGMADWIQVLENARDYQERENLEFRRGVALPFYASGEVAFDEMPQGYQEIDFGSPRFPLTWRDLHENRELNGILSVSAAMANVTVHLYERVESVGDALTSLISEEYGLPGP